MYELKRILKNEYVYSVFIKMIVIVIGLLQSVLIARFLGASLLGTYSYITSIISIGAIVITFGIHQAYPYFRRELGKEKIYRDFFSVTIIIFSLFFVVALLLSLLCVTNKEIRIALILIPLYAYNNVISYMNLIEDPNRKNKCWLFISIIDIVFIAFLMIITSSDLLCVILILLFAELLKGGIYTRALNITPLFHSGLFSLALKLLKMGMWPMLALLMTTLNYKIDILMLRSFDNITAAEIGIYSIGMTYVDKIALIPDTLKGVLASRLSKGAGNQEVAKVTRLCFAASIIICTGFLLLGKQFIYILYGVEYIDAYQIIMICSLGAIFIGYFKLIAQYNIINRKQIRNVILLSISIMINILLNLILIPRFQLVGAAFASSVGYFLSGAVFILWFAKQSKIPIREMFLLQKSDIRWNGFRKNNF